MGFFGNDTIICPYCMDKVQKNELTYKCEKCKTEYPSPNEVSRKSDMSIYMSHKLRYNKKSCGKCGGLLAVMCPKCETVLPSQIFDFDQYINFCIVGQTKCGKTNYITVMIKEFKEKLYSKLHIESMNKETATIQRDHETYLYQNGSPVPATDPENVEKRENLIKPQLWQITDKTRYKKRDEYKVYSLTIIDGAGEDYREMTDTVRRYIKGSDYIFFLLDPCNLAGVKRELGKNDASENLGQEIVDRMANYLRRGFGVSAGKKIDKPVAVIFTKFDEIMSLMELDDQVTKGNDYIAGNEYTYTKFSADVIDSEIRRFLERIGEGYFLGALEKNFKKTRFFCVSSFGYAPTDTDKGQKVGSIMPHRVLDPVMWVLSEQHIIR